MNLGETLYLIRADVHRYRGAHGMGCVLKEFFIGQGCKFSIWLRLTQYLESKRPLSAPFYWFARCMLRRNAVRFGLQIGHTAQIGPGLFIGHYGGIVINGRTRMGRNCNLSQGVTIGTAQQAGKKDPPSFGDNVYIGPGAKIFGAITIGNNVAIGANAVVTKDLPDNAVAVGVPARIISTNGSADYINRTDYD